MFCFMGIADMLLDWKIQKQEKLKGCCCSEPLIQGEVFHFRYRLGKNGLFHIKQKYNEKLAGVTFIGKEIEQESEADAFKAFKKEWEKIELLFH